MWRQESKHKKGQTEFLDAVMQRVYKDKDLRRRADEKLRAFYDKENLAKELFSCPQTPNYHAEGPFAEDHLRLILMSLYAILEEKMHLVDIEEFRRMKGFEGEYEELEEIIKENAASMEAYALCHDIAKPAVITFESRPGSKGDHEGFKVPLYYAWTEEVQKDQWLLMEKYIEMYNDFAGQYKGDSPADIQAKFYLEYQITVHNHGHAHAIFRPEYRELFDRVAEEHRLTVDDADELLHIISLHMDVIRTFRNPNPAGFDKMLQYAQKYGRDSDDFIDLLQAAVFLDVVCGSMRRSPHGVWHEASILENFLRAEYEASPKRREATIMRRQEAKKKKESALLKQAGLDGNSVMELLDMRPSPQFGRILEQIQNAARGQGSLPQVPDEAALELGKRLRQYETLDKNA